MKNELRKIQIEYLKLLKTMSSRLEHEDLMILLDEIQLFWYQKRNIINMAAQYLFKNNDTYVLTAATVFDIDDTSQNIFFVNGKYQIFDDPIPSYLSIVSNSDALGDSFSLYIEKLSSVVMGTIEDEIKLLESSNDSFFIIPLRFYLNIYSLTENLSAAGKNIIDNIFIESITYDDLKNIKDVEAIINPESINNLIFFDGDDPSLTLTERIEIYMKKNYEMIPKGANHSQALYTLLLGSFTQALEIIEMSAQYSVIPFFRSFVPFNYFANVLLLLIENSKDEKEKEQMKMLLRKTTVEYLIYFEFSKIEDGSHTIDDLISRSEKINFQDKVEEIEKRVEGVRNISNIADEINRLIDELLV